MRCPRCGYNELDESEFCSRCGRRLKAAPGTAEGTPAAGARAAAIVEEEEDEETRLKREREALKRRAIIIPSAVVLAALVAFVGYRIAQGPPAKVVGQWSSSSYGGFLALLTSGVKIDIQSETSGGRISGNFTFTSQPQPITQGSVTGHHIFLTTKKPNAYTYYTFSGQVSQDGTTIQGVVTVYTASSNPPATQKQAVTLHKV
jgi:hypothetical protein